MIITTVKSIWQSIHRTSVRTDKGANGNKGVWVLYILPPSCALKHSDRKRSSTHGLLTAPVKGDFQNWWIQFTNCEKITIWKKLTSSPINTQIIAVTQMNSVPTFYESDCRHSTQNTGCVCCSEKQPLFVARTTRYYGRGYMQLPVVHVVTSGIVYVVTSALQATPISFQSFLRPRRQIHREPRFGIHTNSWVRLDHWTIHIAGPWQTCIVTIL